MKKMFYDSHGAPGQCSRRPRGAVWKPLRRNNKRLTIKKKNKNQFVNYLAAS